MLSRIVFFLSLASAASSLSCRWLDQKFSQYNENSLHLLNIMANNAPFANLAEVAFPDELYNQALQASAEVRLNLVLQIMEEVLDLFEEDQSFASWAEATAADFLYVVSRQAEELHSCIGRHMRSKKLHMYFKRLSHQILEPMNYSTEAWELIRKETKILLFRAARLTVSAN